MCSAAGGGAAGRAQGRGCLCPTHRAHKFLRSGPLSGWGGAEREHTESCEPCFAEEEEAGCSRKESTEREIREVSRVRAGDECSTEV